MNAGLGVKLITRKNKKLANASISLDITGAGDAILVLYSFFTNTMLLVRKNIKNYI